MTTDVKSVLPQELQRAWPLAKTFDHFTTEEFRTDRAATNLRHGSQGNRIRASPQYARGREKARLALQSPAWNMK
jgi:hypothetical protein